MSAYDATESAVISGIVVCISGARENARNTGIRIVHMDRVAYVQGDAGRMRLDVRRWLATIGEHGAYAHAECERFTFPIQSVCSPYARSKEDARNSDAAIWHETCLFRRA